MKVSMEGGFRSFVVETYNLQLYEALRKGKKENSMFGHNLHDINALLEQYDEVGFSFVKKTGSRRLAHALL